MIPRYPFTVTIEYREEVKRKPISKSFDTLISAVAALHENIGKRDVRRITISLILIQSEQIGRAV